MFRFPNYLRDPAFRILGSTTENLLGQTDLRSPEGFYLGSFDPVHGITRDAHGFIVGTGNQLSTLLPPTDRRLSTR